MGVEDSWVVGVSAVFTVSRFTGERPEVHSGGTMGVEGAFVVRAQV